jgi:hypothetical protein
MSTVLIEIQQLNRCSTRSFHLNYTSFITIINADAAEIRIHATKGELSK